MSIFDSKKEREKQYFLQTRASSIINVSPELKGHLERYEDPMTNRLNLLKLQRLKFKPSDAVVKKAKKKARKVKRTKNLKGEYARIKREQRRYERGERRDAPGKEPYILGEDYATRMASAVAAGVAAGGGGGIIGPAPAVAIVPPAVAPPVAPVARAPVAPAPFHGLIPPAADLAEVGRLRAQMDQARHEILRLGREEQGVPPAELRAEVRRVEDRYGELDRALTARLGEAEVGIRRMGQVEVRNQVAMDALEQRQTQELEAMGRLLQGHDEEFEGIRQREEAQRELQMAGVAVSEQRSAIQGAELGQLQRERGALQRRMEELQTTHGDELEGLRRQHAQQAIEHTALYTRLSGQQDELSQQVMAGQREANTEATRRMGTIESGHADIRDQLRQQQARYSALDDRFAQQGRDFDAQRQRAERVEEAETQRRQEEEGDLREQISAIARRASEERGASNDTQRRLVEEQAVDYDRQLREIQASGERRVGDLEEQLQVFRDEFRRGDARGPLPEGQYPDSSDEEEADEALEGARHLGERERLRVPSVSPDPVRPDPEPSPPPSPRPLEESGELVEHPADIEQQIEEDIAQGRRAQDVARRTRTSGARCFATGRRGSA